MACSVIMQTSAQPCIPDVTVGCHNGSGKLWVTGGCIGHVRCPQCFGGTVVSTFHARPLVRLRRRDLHRRFNGTAPAEAKQMYDQLGSPRQVIELVGGQGSIRLCGEHNGFSAAQINNGSVQRTNLLVADEAPATEGRVGVDTPLRPRCDSREATEGTWLLVIAVLSSAAHGARRAAIRRTWFALTGDDRTNVLACFGVGALPTSQGALPTSHLERERVLHGDLLLLNATHVSTSNSSLVGSMFETSFGWWLTAAIRFPRANFLAKTDDDSYVHVPRLAAYLSTLTCAPSLIFGHLVFGSFNPSLRYDHGFRCLWSRGWVPQDYLRQQCDMKGAHPPVPYPIGALVVFSQAIASWLAQSEDVRRAAQFAIQLGGRCASRAETHAQGCGEDGHVGFWASRAPPVQTPLQRLGARGSSAGPSSLKPSSTFPPTILYVRANWALVHDIKCTGEDRAEWPSSLPSLHSVVVHKLKLPSGIDYVHGVLGRGVLHNVTACRMAVWNSTVWTRHGHK